MLPREKLKSLVRRHQEVESLLCDPGVLADMKKLNSLNRERGQLVPIVEAMGKLEGVERRIREDEEALDDPDLGPLARQELPELQAEQKGLEQELRLLLLPKDPNDEKNTILEIRGGT
ncbi:MAG TPA: PCRF domain-containing protein, partial [Polyangiaceae bacterium]|nr:PCRF domain-containing protein [Polyangiaceae bacterium]